MSTVASMHEDVHERTCQKQHIRKNSEEMSGMFRDEIESRDCEKPDQNDVFARSEKAGLSIFRIFGPHFVFMLHDSLLLDRRLMRRLLLVSLSTPGCAAVGPCDGAVVARRPIRFPRKSSLLPLERELDVGFLH
jgi:hypothetical protein